jgi:hypothetical protein
VERVGTIKASPMKPPLSAQAVAGINATQSASRAARRHPPEQLPLAADGMVAPH